MAENNRIYYACQVVGIKPCLTSDVVTPVHGVQSIGINTSFNLEQAFELGMVQIYENIENLPEVEVTMEKVLDGYPLLYHLATPTATNAGLVSRSKEKCSVSLGIYPDDKDAVSGVAPVEVFLSGLYVSQLSYTIPVEGNLTESITVIGNSKRWFTSASGNPVGFTGTNAINLNTAFKIDSATGAGGDYPLALDMGVSGALGFRGGIQRRENVRVDKSILPTSIYGVSGTGVGNAYLGVYGNGGAPRVHLQNISISTSTGREDLLELGAKTPYYKAATFPIEVSTEIEAISTSGDFINAYQYGDPAFIGTKNVGSNTREEKILVRINDGTCFDLGTRNRLQSVNYGGGDAGGGNVTLSYSYVNYNDLRVLHLQDPAIAGYTPAEAALIDLTSLGNTLE
jgi:hypothetical protein